MVLAMNRAFAILLAALALLLPAVAQAQVSARVVSTTSWIEEWDPVSQQWVRVDEGPADIAPARYESPTTTVSQVGNVTVTETVSAEPVRFITQPNPQWMQGAGIAQFGPFRVLDENRAALVGSTDAAAPRVFEAMMNAYPGLQVIEFVDAPGTNNDLANLALGRAIRAAGLATHVPAGGSARSGAVELFLAGTHRTMAPQALFAVHSWRDAAGREPADFAPDAPENRLYLDYYAEMGMSADEARAFYAMTNSVPHAGALWLEGAEMERWIAREASNPRAPALPELMPMLESSLRLVLERTGKAWAEAAQAPWVGPRAVVAPPRLVYADIGVMPLALLDSSLAFP